MQGYQSNHWATKNIVLFPELQVVQTLPLKVMCKIKLPVKFLFRNATTFWFTYIIILQTFVHLGYFEYASERVFEAAYEKTQCNIYTVRHDAAQVTLM